MIEYIQLDIVSDDELDISTKKAYANLNAKIKGILNSTEIKDLDVNSKELNNMLNLEKNNTTLDNNSIKNVLKEIMKYKRVIILNDEQEGIIKNVMGMFVQDIYKDSLHFFLEIIQNADDCSKSNKTDEENSLDITITTDKDISFEYNDRGFNFSDIMAITSLGNSTKKSQLDNNADIGEKGIGFKSIFAIADRVNIESKYFNFSIDSTKGLINILEPCDVSVNIENDENKKTKLTLILKEDLKNNDDFFKQINDWINNNVKNTSIANPFLFLKNITKINVIDERKENQEENQEINKSIIKTKIPNTNFTYITIGDDEYIVYTEMMEFNKEAIISRWEHLKDNEGLTDNYILERPAEICFPLTTEINSTKINGKIYSYLPTNIELPNFPCFINLDVHLTASRGNITKEDFASNSHWNNQVKTELPKFLTKTYIALTEQYKLENPENNKFQNACNRLCEKLYEYLQTISNSSIMYAVEINKKLQELKMSEAIFLNNNSEFEKAEGSKLYYINNGQAKMEYIYHFLNTKSGDFNYPKNPKWNELLYDYNGYYNDKTKNINQIIEDQSGIKKYWGEFGEKENITAIEVINDIANNYSNFDTTTNNNIHNEIDIILIENNGNKNKYDIVSMKYIVDNITKPLFFHTTDQALTEDTVNSVFIYEETIPEGQKSTIFDLKSLYENENKYNIKVYDIKEFFKNKFNELPSLLDYTNQDHINFVGTFINETFDFYNKNTNCYGEDNREKLNEFLKHFTFDEKIWKDEYEYIEGKSEYLQKLSSKSGIKIWSIPEKYNDDEHKQNFINYLIYLGIKNDIEIIDDGNGVIKLDEYSMSMNIMPNLLDGVIVDDTNRELIFGEDDYLTKLQKFYLQHLNIDKINDIKITGFHQDISNKFINEKFKWSHISITDNNNHEFAYNEKNIIIINSGKIKEFNMEVDTVKDTTNISWNDSTYCIINSTYLNVWEKLGVLYHYEYNNDNIINNLGKNYNDKNLFYEFISSFNVMDNSDFIKSLLYISILNKVFGVTYQWGGNGNPLNLEIDKFCSCYKYLNITLPEHKHSLGALMLSGYTIECLQTCRDTLGDLEELCKFLNDLLQLPKNSEILLANFNDIAMIKDDNFTHDYFKAENCKNKYDNVKTEIKYIVKVKSKKSDMLFTILEEGLLNNIQDKLRDSDKKAIKDYYDEIDYNTRKPLESTTNGYYKYSAGLAYKDHEDELNGICIHNIWDKSIMENLCNPYNFTMEGYGYTCPICGSVSYSALNGLKFNRYSRNGKKLYIYSCLNCASMLDYAKSIEIENYDDIMKKFEYFYCADNNHYKNQAKMMTVTLKVVTYDSKILHLPMKVSYYNMLMYYKLNK